MSSELDRLARMMKMRTEDEIVNRRQADFAGRKATMEAIKRNKRQEKQERRKVG